MPNRDIILKLDGIDGESTVKGHEKEFAVLVLVTHVVQRAGTGAQYPITFDTLDTGASSDGVMDEATLDFARIRWECRAELSGPFIRACEASALSLIRKCSPNHAGKVRRKVDRHADAMSQSPGLFGSSPSRRGTCENGTGGNGRGRRVKQAPL